MGKRKPLTPEQLKKSSAMEEEAKPLLARLWALRCQRAEELTRQQSQANGSATVDPLTVKLGDLREEARQEAHTLENDLISIYAPKARRIAEYYANSHYSADELFSLVVYGAEHLTDDGFYTSSLRGAIWNFDLRRGAEFGSVAYHAMKHAISREAILESTGQRNFERRVKRIPGDFKTEGYDADDDRRPRTDQPDENFQVRRQLSLLRRSPIQQYRYGLAQTPDLLPFLVGNDAQNPYRAHEQKETLLKHLEAVGRTIPGDKHQKALALILEGIRENDAVPTLETIGKALVVTRERARQLIGVVMKRLEAGWAARVAEYPDELGDYPRFNSLEVMRERRNQEVGENGASR